MRYSDAKRKILVCHIRSLISSEKSRADGDCESSGGEKSREEKTRQGTEDFGGRWRNQGGDQEESVPPPHPLSQSQWPRSEERALSSISWCIFHVDLNQKVTKSLYLSFSARPGNLIRIAPLWTALSRSLFPQFQLLRQLFQYYL